MPSKRRKQRKPKLNVKLLRKIKRHILAEPKRLEMDIWYRHWDGLSKKDMRKWGFPSCGTKACIAGWAVILGQPTQKERAEALIDSDDSDYYDLGRKFLGLTMEEANALFLSEGVRGGTKEDAKFMAAMIDSLIKNRRAFVLAE